MYWEQSLETMEPQGAGEAPAAPAQCQPGGGPPLPPLRPGPGPLPPAGVGEPGRPGRAALHRQGRPARGLPVRLPGRAAGGGGAPAFLLRDHGQPHGGVPHPGGHRRVGEPDRPLHVRHRGAQDGRLPEHDGLRPVHRRHRLPLRCRAAGRDDHPDRAGQLQAADLVPAAPGHHRHPHPAQLRAAPGRLLPGAGHRPAPGPEAAHRLRRRRAAQRGHPAENRGNLRPEGLQLLRPVGDVRAGGGLRVPAAERAAPVGGPLLPGDHRPGLRAGRCPRGRKASWSSPPSSARPCP